LVFNSTTGALESALDKSGNNHTLTKPTGIQNWATFPTHGTTTQNGLNVFEYNRSLTPTMYGSTYSIPDTTGNKFAMIFVTKNDFVDNQSFLFAAQNETQTPRMWARKISYGNIDLLNGTQVLRSSGTQPTGPCIVTLVYDETDSYIGINGSYYKNTNPNYVFDGENVSSIRFGTNEISQQSINGFYGEFCTMLNTSDLDIQKAEGYLAHKWGLANDLDSTHPYKSGAPTTTGSLPPPPAVSSVLSDAYLWLDAEDTSTIVTQSGSSEVDSWTDKSGNLLTFTPQIITNSQKPTTGTTINGKNTILFNANASMQLDPIATQYKNPTSVFIVAQWTDTSGQFNFNGLITGTDSSLSSDIGLYTTNNPRIANSGWYAGNVKVNGVAYTHGIDIRPTLEDPFLVSGVTTSDATVSTGLNIGSERGTLGRGWEGPIAEVLVFDFPVGVVRREIIEGYLAHKWGFASNLPAGHPYKSTAPS
jgi:hypothetical protein